MILLLVGSALSRGDSVIARETRIKAAFVYNFLKFIDWPSHSFQEANSPIVIGVVGESPIAVDLQSVAKDHNLNGRNIVVKQVQSVDEFSTVHVLFFTAPENDSMLQSLHKLKSRSVLTVGESDKFAATGGMITFVRESDKVRFQINSDSAKDAGLKVSAQLLRLARPVPSQK